jgi:hypothetical protein
MTLDLLGSWKRHTRHGRKCEILENALRGEAGRCCCGRLGAWYSYSSGSRRLGRAESGLSNSKCPRRQMLSMHTSLVRPVIDDLDTRGGLGWLDYGLGAAYPARVRSKVHRTSCELILWGLDIAVCINHSRSSGVPTSFVILLSTQIVSQNTATARAW